MNTQELIGEVAKQHNIQLGPKDPVFVTLTLNKLILEDYLKQVNDQLEAHQNHYSAAAEQQIDAAKAAASKIITGAADYMANEAKKTFADMQGQLLKAIEKKMAQTNRDANMAKWCAIISVLFVSAFFLGIALAAFHVHLW